MRAFSEQQFRDRRDAGKALAERLQAYAGREGVMVLGLPRGGVPVAYEVAAALDLPLDVFVVRKLGVPGFEELAMGALASGGIRVLNPDVLAQVAQPEEALARVTFAEAQELQRREKAYRGENAPPLELHGQTVIIVDDGLATGATMRAAVHAVRARAASRCVVAVPVASEEAWADFHAEADEFICVIVSAHFHAVGQFYDNFSETSDAEVRALLAQAAGHRSVDSRS